MRYWLGITAGHRHIGKEIAGLSTCVDWPSTCVDRKSTISPAVPGRSGSFTPGGSRTEIVCESHSQMEDDMGNSRTLGDAFMLFDGKGAVLPRTRMTEILNVPAGTRTAEILDMPPGTRIAEILNVRTAATPGTRRTRERLQSADAHVDRLVTTTGHPPAMGQVSTGGWQ